MDDSWRGHPSTRPSSEALPIEAATLTSTVDPLEEQAFYVEDVITQAAAVAANPKILQMSLPMLQGVSLHRSRTFCAHRLQAPTQLRELTPHRAASVLRRRVIRPFRQMRR